MISNYTVTGKTVKVKTEFSWDLIAIFKKNGGKWNKESKTWDFPIARLEFIKENLGSGALVTVEITKDQLDIAYQTYAIGWYIVAFRPGRDDAVKLYGDLVKGELPNFGGSVKNPAVKASDDSVFHIKVTRDFAVARDLNIIETKSKKELLLEEKAQLEKRIAEIIGELK